MALALVDLVLSNTESSDQAAAEGNLGQGQLAGRGWRRSLSTLSNTDFRMLMVNCLFYMAAAQIDIVARPWLAYSISGSALTLGLVTLARGAPAIVFSLLGGLAADRFDKRKVLIYTQLALAVFATINALLVHLGIVEVWHLVVLGALQGAVFPLNFPARNAYIPELVGREKLSGAIAVSANVHNVNRVLAPALAGLLIAWSPAVAFYAIAACYVVGVITVWNLPASPPDSRPAGALAEMVASVRLVWDSAALRAFMVLAFAAAMLGFPYQSLLTVFQTDVLHVGPAELGFMFMATGVGSLLGSLVVVRLSDHPRRVLMQFALGAGFGLSLIAFSLSGDYTLSLALLVIVGLTSQGFVAINNVLIMLNTDRRHYGRVMGLYYLTWSIMPIATMPLGAAADLFGVSGTQFVAAGLLAIFVIAIALKYQAQWRLQRPRTMSP